MIYDYIIVGAGIGGLSAGLNLIANNKKVLNNWLLGPGERATGL